MEGDGGCGSCDFSLAAQDTPSVQNKEYNDKPPCSNLEPCDRTSGAAPAGAGRVGLLGPSWDSDGSGLGLDLGQSRAIEPIRLARALVFVQSDRVRAR